VLNLVLQPVLLMGLVVNDRRVAFLGLGAGVLSLVALGPQVLRRWLKRSLVVLAPAALVYVGVGWNSNASVFKPVQALKSVTDESDAVEPDTRHRELQPHADAEAESHPRLGVRARVLRVRAGVPRGRGLRAVPTAFIAHNSVLWLLSLSGFAGFTMLWAVFPVAVLVARRVLRGSTSAVDRTTAYSAVMAVMCFVIQAWADMGLQSWMGVLVLTSLTGATGALWTAHTRAGIPRTTRMNMTRAHTGRNPARAWLRSLAMGQGD